jgi:hypothetical protein
MAATALNPPCSRRVWTRGGRNTASLCDIADLTCSVRERNTYGGGSQISRARFDETTIRVPEINYIEG